MITVLVSVIVTISTKKNRYRTLPITEKETVTVSAYIVLQCISRKETHAICILQHL
jgi:hypothetical protein